MREGTIIIEGNCPSGDAEELLQLLLSHPAAGVDWRACDGVHTAVVQVLLAARRDILGPPRGAVVKSLIDPALARGLE
jgi:hypothetical protein